jgi:acyl-CoA reductase-like NAD-dependent aldehyde dehydrogenase
MLSATHLANVPAKSIARAIANAAERWSDGDFPPRVRILDRIADRTGYSLPAIEYALDRIFFSINERDLLAVIGSELGGTQFLDGFAPRSGRPDAWAAPAGGVCIISSRTTVGVAIVPAIFALCAKCDVLVKDREDSLVAAFFETLREELDEFAGAAQAATWTSGAVEAPDLETFDAVAAFGSDDTLAKIAQGLRPGARFIGYGSRASAGYVARDALENAGNARVIAQGAARDLVLYESEGCLSLHALFVETGGAVEPDAFAKMLAGEVERAAVEFPLGERDESTAARLAHYRDLAAFRAAGSAGAVYANEAAHYAVVLNPPHSEPPQFLPRTIGVISVEDPAQALAYLREHRLPLEGFAIAGSRDDVVQAAIDAGAVRLTRFGELQHPPLGGDHGGRPRIAEFVKWIDRSL